MSFTVGGSTPQLTFADATVQNTAFTGLNQSATPFTTSLGYQALNSNTGANNTAVGYQALYSNTTATNNTAYGYQAGYSAVTGATNNTFIGYQAGYSTITSGSNQFFGYLAGYNVTTGYYNTILGSYNGNQGGLDIRTANNYIVLSDGQGNPRLISDGSGHFGIGTNPANTLKMSVSDSAYGSSFYVSGASTQAVPSIYFEKADNTSTTSQVFVQFTINAKATGSGQINANGASQAAFGSFSDIRLKENIVNIPSQLNNVCSLRPVEFDYKDGSGHQIGFIAQEIQQIFPDVVGERTDGMLTVTGWNKTEAIIVKAIQELKAEFDAYKATHP